MAQYTVVVFKITKWYKKQEKLTLFSTNFEAHVKKGTFRPYCKVKLVFAKISAKRCCGSGIFIQDPGSDFFPSRIRFFPSRIRFFSFPDPGLDPGSGSSLKNLSILTQETDIKFSQIRSRMFITDLGSWLWFFLPSRIPDSRIQGSKKHRIPDPRAGSATLRPSYIQKCFDN